ncbi:MAG: MFS transporter [Solirubrobacteraceae bacterium]
MAYLLLLTLGAIDAAGYGVMAPVVPEIAAATSASPAGTGALVAMLPLGMLAGFLAAGAAVVRVAPKVVILAGLALVVIGSLGFVLADGIEGYFGARLLMGAGSGGLWIGITFETLTRWPGDAYVCMSRIFAAYSAGGLIGPALGAIDGITGPFLAYATLGASTAIPVALLLDTGPAGRFTRDRDALRSPGFRLASAAILFAVLGLGIVEGVLPLRLAVELDQAEIAVVYGGVALLVVAVAAGAARLSPRTDVIAAAVLITGGLSVAGGVEDVCVWLGALFVVGAGIGLGNTGSIGVLLDAVPSDRIVSAMVVWSQIGIAGYLLGPLVGGAVVEVLGFGALGLLPLGAGVALLVAVRRTA